MTDECKELSAVQKQVPKNFQGIMKESAQETMRERVQNAKQEDMLENVHGMEQKIVRVNVHTSAKAGRNKKDGSGKDEDTKESDGNLTADGTGPRCHSESD